MPRGPLGSPQSVHLWHEQGASRGGRNLGRRGGRTPGSRRRGTSPAGPRRRRCRCAPGAFPGAGLTGSPLPRALGRARREKADFSPYPEGTVRSPTRGLGPLELFAPFRAVWTGARLAVPKSSLDLAKGRGARGSTSHCTASAKRSTFCLISSEDSN